MLLNQNACRREEARAAPRSGIDPFPGFIHEAADVTASDIAQDHDAALAHVTADLSRPLDDFDLRELSQRDERAGRRWNKNLPDRLDIIARGFGKTHGKSKDLQPLIDGARLLAADGGLDNFVNVSDVDAVAAIFFRSISIWR